MSHTGRVYVAYTGGTIGMSRSARGGYKPEPGFLREQMRRMGVLRREGMPSYHVAEYEPLLDSSDMTLVDWLAIAEDIAERYDSYDGFIVLHGTDTMAYAASALSFMLESLAKPVVFTGSQVPLVELRTDARENLINSLMIAARAPVPEVCLFVGDRLLRGNRSTKVSASRYLAFDSPNYPLLAKVGVEFRLSEERLLPTPSEPLQLKPMVDSEDEGVQIADVRLFPGMTASVLGHFLERPLRGAVLHTYGLGNGPSHPDFLAELKKATDRGLVLVNCTQCLEGTVDMTGYATGRALADSGVIGGYDMTPEAALTKMHWLFGQGLSSAEVSEQMQRSLRGELTRPDA
ncbi:MAG: asparaginase [Acidobacteriota bacterium]